MPPKRRLPANAPGSQSKRTARAGDSGTPVPGDPAPPPARKVYAVGELCTYVAKVVDDDDDSYTFIQPGTCQRWPATKYVDQCIACIEKQATAGSCRFMRQRVFKASRDANGEQVVQFDQYAFKSSQDGPLPRPRAKAVRKDKTKPVHPRGRAKARKDSEDSDDGDARLVYRKSGRAYATPVRPAPLVPTKAQARYALPWIATEFSQHLRSEYWQETVNAGERPILRLHHIPETRACCDICAASFHLGSYMCGCCGREFCKTCYNNWVPSGTLVSGKLSRMDQCSRKRRHSKESMLFVTRSKPGELRPLLDKVVKYRMSRKQFADRHKADEKVGRLPTIQASFPSPDGPLFLPVITMTHEEMSLEDFQSVWRACAGPIVLTGLKSCFKLPWDDIYFKDQHGAEKCLIHDCETDTATESTVAEFFTKFAAKGNKKSLKLKDWPPTADFKDSFPLLFADFENAVPFPTYTRRSGPMNLASYFPSGWNAPDLGPKMYHATPSLDFMPVQDEDSLTESKKEKRKRDVVGTTNLHLDLTDAVNIMLYETGGEDAPRYSTTEKGIPECGAVWDIFRPEDSEKIREYLKRRNPEIDDPIHRQMYYLSEHDLSLLAKEGVGSFRIYQNTGDAVFIPAGCAHQVRNRKSCVKVAVDYLSPEHIDQCHILLKEAMAMAPKYSTNGFREKPKEDVLQLWSCLDFAWKKLYGLIEGDADASDEELRNRGDRFLSRDEDSDDESDAKDDGGAPPPPPPPPPPGPNDDDDDGDGNGQDRNGGSHPPPPPPPGPDYMDQDQQDHIIEEHEEILNPQDDDHYDENLLDFHHYDDHLAAEKSLPTPAASESSGEHTGNNSDVPFWPARYVLPAPAPLPKFIEQDARPARTFSSLSGNSRRTNSQDSGKSTTPYRKKDALSNVAGPSFHVVKKTKKRSRHYSSPTFDKWFRTPYKKDVDLAAKQEGIFHLLSSPAVRTVPGFTSGESTEEDQMEISEEEDSESDVDIIDFDDALPIEEAHAVPEAEHRDKESRSERKSQSKKDIDQAIKAAKKMMKDLRKESKKASKAAKKELKALKKIRKEAKKTERLVAAAAASAKK